MQFHMWSYVVFMDIRLKMQTGKKNPKRIDWRKAQGFLCWRIMTLFILPSIQN